MVLYLQSAPSCLFQLSLNQTAVSEATLVVLPTRVPQLRLLSIKQTKVLQLSQAHLTNYSFMFVLVVIFLFFSHLLVLVDIVLPG